VASTATFRPFGAGCGSSRGYQTARAHSRRSREFETRFPLIRHGADAPYYSPKYTSSNSFSTREMKISPCRSFRSSVFAEIDHFDSAK